MKVRPTNLAEVFVIEPSVHADARGLLFESYAKRDFDAATGTSIDFVQDNHSHSVRGVLRGMHFQQSHPQAKLIRVVRGTIWDVAVDIDPASATFKQHFALEISAENRLQMLVGRQYAHGFCVLSESSDVLYKCDDYYVAGDGRGIVWNDSELAIPWPITNPILSEQDRSLPPLDGLV